MDQLSSLNCSYTTFFTLDGVYGFPFVSFMMKILPLHFKVQLQFPVYFSPFRGFYSSIFCFFLYRLSCYVIFCFLLSFFLYLCVLMMGCLVQHLFYFHHIPCSFSVNSASAIWTFWNLSFYCLSAFEHNSLTVFNHLELRINWWQWVVTLYPIVRLYDLQLVGVGRKEVYIPMSSCDEEKVSYKSFYG